MDGSQSFADVSVVDLQTQQLNRAYIDGRAAYVLDQPVATAGAYKTPVTVKFRDAQAKVSADLADALKRANLITNLKGAWFPKPGKTQDVLRFIASRQRVKTSSKNPMVVEAAFRFV